MTGSRRPKEQRRARRIAMTDAELDTFLAVAWVCRLGSIGRTGPHVTPVWFVWDGDSLWISSLVKSQRWHDLQQDPRVAATIDDGRDYAELRGVELRGRIEVVGEVPRVGTDRDPALDSIEQAFARKYRGAETVEHDGRHAWLRLRPEKLVSWDFRKLPSSQGL
jgi:hypothetical protein